MKRRPDRAALSAGIFALSLLAGIVVASNAQIGVARLIVVLAFLTLAPGGALLNLLLPDLKDWSTTLLLTVGASLALDVASTETALWSHTWDPAGIVGALAVLAAAVSGISLVRVRASQLVVAVPNVRLPDWTRRARYWPVVAVPTAVLLVGLGVELAGGHPKRAVTGPDGAVAAGIATVALVFLVFSASSAESSERRHRGLVASSLLVALVVAIVTARFLIIR